MPLKRAVILTPGAEKRGGSSGSNEILPEYTKFGSSGPKLRCMVF
jgi:hypothetical protein